MRRLAIVASITLALTACDRRADLAALRPEPSFPIVFVLVDALRADRALAMRDGRSLAPNIARLAADGVTFRSAFSSAPKTIPSVPQILTSQHFPDVHHRTTLFTVLGSAGYDATAGIIHNPYVARWAGRLDRSFTHVDARDVGAAAMTDSAIAWLADRPSDRIAMYVHYLDVHMPVAPPEDIARRFVDDAYHGPIGLEFHDISGAWAGRYDADDRRRIGQLYDAAVAATDVQIGRLLDALAGDGLYDRALVVLTADHGEELWDHGGFFHGHTLYDELLHVPLVVKFPGNWAAGAKVDDLARSIDILPTIADLLARANPSLPALDETDGQSLVALVGGQRQERTVFATMGRTDDRSPPLEAVRTSTAKLVHDMRTGDEQLFDLVRDPGETDNLVSDPAAAGTLERLRAELQEQLEPLLRSGIHLRLSNRTTGTLHYDVTLTLKPVAPFVDLATFDMEPGDVLVPAPRSGGFTVTGVLEPGDRDEVRFGVLAHDGAVVAKLATGEAGVAVETCIANEPQCTPLENGKASVSLARMTTAGDPPEPAERAEHGGASLAMQWWMLPPESAPIAPELDPADRERLRALGYAE